jgi:hypothetical protein
MVSERLAVVRGQDDQRAPLFVEDRLEQRGKR